MRKSNAGRRIWFALAAAAVTVGCAVSVNAQVLDFASRGGFYSGSVANGGVDPATILQGSTGGAPVAGVWGTGFLHPRPEQSAPGADVEGAILGLPQPNQHELRQRRQQHDAVVDLSRRVRPGCCRTEFARGAGSVGPDRHRQLDSDHQGHPSQSRRWPRIQRAQHGGHLLVPVSGQSPCPDRRARRQHHVGRVHRNAKLSGPARDELRQPGWRAAGEPGRQHTRESMRRLRLRIRTRFEPVVHTCRDWSAMRLRCRSTSGLLPPGSTPTCPDGALVCGAPLGQVPNPDPLCNGYTGPPIVIYTAERGNNEFSVEAQLSPVITTALFVIGDCEYDQAKLKKGRLLRPTTIFARSATRSTSGARSGGRTTA